MLKIKQLYYEAVTRHLGPLDLSIANGEIVGVAGKNGSGKSLLLEVIARPDLNFTGNVLINHYNSKSEPNKTIKQFAFVSASKPLENHLTGIEYLEFVAINYELPLKNRLAPALKLAEDFEIKKQLYTLIENLNESTRQKLRIIAAFMAHIPVILLDEPLLYLDYSSQKVVINLIKKASHTGSSIIVSSNNLSFLEKISDKIVILEDGELISEGTLAQLQNIAGTKTKNLEDIIEELAR